jgi:DNA (cytosine-5)-methyltransferase 1
LKPRFISLFSGVGGLESGQFDPVACCEIDRACWPVLRTRFPMAELFPDVTTFSPPRAEVVTGGWPCQDISVAGRQAGLGGERSGLFYHLVRIAKQSKSHTVVAENVPNLLTMQGGLAFHTVVQTFAEAGFPFLAWRSLNARAFGLPHHRERVFIVASKHETVARSLHRQLPKHRTLPRRKAACSAFYWTGGLQSICYNNGFAPTLKVGSALSIPSPPAVHFSDCVRKMTSRECLRLQGFDPTEFRELSDKDVYRVTGNAVARPVGQFVVDSVSCEATPGLEGCAGLFGTEIAKAGYYSDGRFYRVEDRPSLLATNLADFIDLKHKEPMSARAAGGLLSRLVRSGKPCPAQLFLLLKQIAASDKDPAVAVPPFEGMEDSRLHRDELPSPLFV